MNLDWKWMGIGVATMLVLSIGAGVSLALVLGPQLEGVTDVEQIEQLELSGGQMALIGILNFLAFLIGGVVVGLKSAGRTILEPGISAAVAVAILLAVSGGFSIGNLMAGGLVPFVAGVLGGWLGERRQSARG